ncbi:MAG: UDP-N-acetylglucosamine--N-acetylmuramyl-(pentapeptide) pyrophosphoryl-undecaprenol N-acetylglucosamine transferase [Acidimicrobiales bacterium]
MTAVPAVAAGDDMSERADRVFALIAGGGTAGHVHPALAVAEALVDAGHDRDSIVFVGSTTGMEAQLVPDAGFRLVPLAVTNFPRRPSVQLLTSTGRLVVAAVRSVRLLRALRPRVLVSVGGFASVAPVIAAKLTGVPVVAIAYDAVPGLATRLTARVAAATAVAFPACRLPRSEITGAPISASIASTDRTNDRAAARAKLGVPLDRFLLLVVGGSLGSGRLNELVDAFVAAHGDRADLAVRHLVGARNDDGSRKPLDGAGGILYQVIGFDTAMDIAYAASDLALTRAGATVTAELAAVGLPAIVVPWPAATNDHQTANGRALAATGGAVLIAESDLTPTRLAAEIERLRINPNARAAMAAGAHSLAKADAAVRIATIVERLAR